MNDGSGAAAGRFRQTAALGLLALGVLLVGGWSVVMVLRSPPAGTVAAPVAASPQTIQEILDAARTYMDRDQAASAEVILRASVDRNPANQSLRLLLGECLLQQKRLEESYDEYTQGIFIGPDHPEYRFVAGTIASQLGRTEDAEAHYRMAQSMNPSNPKFPLYLAQVQRKLGKADEARANLVIATKLDESLSVAWATLAAIALDENRLEMAKQYIGRARSLEPMRGDYRAIEAKVLRRGNRPEEAAAVLEEMPERDRLNDPTVLLELGLCYGMLGRAGDAAAMYAKAVGERPDDAELSYQAALWLERDGQPGRAETYARHAAAKGHEGAKKWLERAEKE